MKKIQEELKKQYNTSIGFYNKGDYEHYFFHTRKSIELIGKFLIFDTLKIKGEEDKASKIIAGDSSFDLDFRNKVCNLVQKLVKTEDIHPPKTGISVHFCVLSLMAMQK
ncbi:MAG: hypothetical protein MSS51_10425 [Bacteroidales bacterium]|nr:hypothetical protein [Bacteroidales bacterium]